MAAERILIVDDEPVILSLVCRALENRYEVLSVSSPQNALAIVKTTPQIDLVSSDVEMPGMRGPDLLSEITKISPSTAGLLMSGNGEAAAQLPTDMPFLQKPFSSEELYAVVERVLARSRKLRADLTNTMEKSTELVEQTLRLKRDAHETMCKSAELLNQSDSRHKPSPNVNDTKRAAGTIICAFCSAVLSANVSACNQCDKPVGLYSIVFDGYTFGIALDGEIRLHGMNLKRAQELASILNSIK
jgi:CheY-like chemotaxis protein